MRFVAAGLCPVQRIDRSSRVYLPPGSAEMGGLNVYHRHSRTQSYSITRSHSKDRRIRNTPPHRKRPISLSFTLLGEQRHVI